MLEDLGAAFTGLSILYLLWFGWHVFVREGGNPGALGLLGAVLAFGQLFSAIQDAVG